MVCTRCFTYNHAPYIVDAMNGFTMQQTTFPVITCIVDDASTDGEPEVIRQYLTDHFQAPYRVEETDDYHLICAHHKTNPNCHFVVLLLKYNHYSIRKSKQPYLSEWSDNAKYVALCEGDDYWIAPDKLQIQVDFMEENEEYSCCYTKYNSFDHTRQTVKSVGGCDYVDIREMLWNDVQIATCTILYKSKLRDSYNSDISPSNKNWLMGDKPLFLYLGHKGFTKLIPRCMATYRIVEESASHSKNYTLQLKRARNTIDIYHYFAEKYFPGDIRMSSKIEGGYLYRAYLIYKNAKVAYPEELKRAVFKYYGGYRKVYLVKVLLLLPIFENFIYKLAYYKERLKIKIQ